MQGITGPAANSPVKVHGVRPTLETVIVSALAKCSKKSSQFRRTVSSALLFSQKFKIIMSKTVSVMKVRPFLNALLRNCTVL